jgi:hypothetical protein
MDKEQWKSLDEIMAICKIKTGLAAEKGETRGQTAAYTRHKVAWCLTIGNCCTAGLAAPRDERLKRKRGSRQGGYQAMHKDLTQIRGIP